MTKLRSADPFMSSREYARTLKGLTLNLLVKAVGRSLAFQREVLGATVMYSDPDFAVLRGYDGEWMLHADHTFDHHVMSGLIADVAARGIGVELRLYGCNPDRAESNARRLGFRVLTPATDKNHGVREAHLMDADGYVWVPDVPTT